MPCLEKPVEIAQSYGQALSYHGKFEKFLTPAKVLWSRLRSKIYSRLFQFVTGTDMITSGL